MEVAGELGVLVEPGGRTIGEVSCPRRAARKSSSEPPSRSWSLTAPAAPDVAAAPLTQPVNLEQYRVRKLTRAGDLIKEYRLAA